MSLSRREFVRGAGTVLLPGVLLQSRPVQSRPDSARSASGAAADTLRNPIGRAAAVGPLDNDPRVVALERRLRCTCGCTLDVYTCRTTDFSCTYSPAMHQAVVAQVQRGDSNDQIVAAFVGQYGESVLMAPPAHGFNLAGYLVPGFSVAAVGLALAAWLTRHREPVAVVAAPRVLAADPDAAQLEELRRALDDVES